MTDTEPKARGLTGVSATFSASHNDPVRRELHGHSYLVTAWWPSPPERDAVCLQATLRTVLAGGFDHKTLPPDLTRAEAMSAAIKALLDGCVAVDIARPLEGLFYEDARP